MGNLSFQVLLNSAPVSLAHQVSLELSLMVGATCAPSAASSRGFSPVLSLMQEMFSLFRETKPRDLGNEINSELHVF